MGESHVLSDGTCATGDSDIMVSVVILTYNHERFIGEAIESVLMQKTDFPCELIIAEDCSTDGTRDVIRRYWERYPGRIRVLLNRHNIGGRRTSVRAYRTCRGRYLIRFDGDDYWTCPEKLQRQVDLMEAHPEHALCFHSVEVVWDDGSRENMRFRPVEVKETYTLADFLDHCIPAACSVLYRRGVFDGYPAWYFTPPVGDWPGHILYAQHGTIGYIDEPMGVWRHHGGGVHSMKANTHKMRIAIEVLRRFRCVIDREYQGVINRSLCRHYCQMAHFFCDAGKYEEARASMKECLREVSFASRLPVGRLTNALLRSFAPGLQRQCKRVARAVAASPGRSPEAGADMSRSMNEQGVR